MSTRNLYNALEDIGIEIPEILLPKNSTDLTKWSVVACDQYTSQPQYWAQVEEITSGIESTLHLIFPEVYLEREGHQNRIDNINAAMRAYLEKDILKSQKPGFIYIDRKTSHTASRKGLILAVDLERYDYNKGSRTLIRATEGTVLERIPPRVRIREKASLELPHIMLLIDDPGETVIEPLADKTGEYEKLYDFELMMNGGHIKGYKVDDEESIGKIVEALHKLADAQTFREKYGVGSDNGILLFAVGDGNHSLATAKAHWENIKKSLPAGELADHPARFALVEVVNVHDEGLQFEPIHRVVFNVDPLKLLDSAVEYFNSNGSKAYYQLRGTRCSMESDAEVYKEGGTSHVIPFITKGHFGTLVVERSGYNLEVGTLQAFLDEYLKKNTDMKIDYIHGDEIVTQLGSNEGNIGFFLPPMDKHDLFKTVILDGVLPRKTFSMGEAEEKRFYLECRKIVKE